MNRVPVRHVDALLLAAGREGTPIPHTIPYDATLFAGLIGAARLHRATLTAPDGAEIALWLNGSANPHNLTHNELATRLYQRLSTVSTTILGDVILTGADGNVSWSAVELVQGLHATFERSITAALAACTERGVG